MIYLLKNILQKIQKYKIIDFQTKNKPMKYVCKSAPLSPAKKSYIN